MDLYRLSLRALPHKRILLAAAFLVGFAMAAAVFVVAGALSLGTALSHHIDHQLHSLDELTSKWVTTLNQLEEVDQSNACSPAFMRKLQEIAFLPDGIHEFLYAPNNKVVCTARGRLEQSVDVGTPDFAIRDGEIDIWTKRDLAVPGPIHEDVTLIGAGNYLMVVTQPGPVTSDTDWIDSSVSFNRDDLEGRDIDEFHNRSIDLHQKGCDVNRFFCVEGSVSVFEALSERFVRVVFGFVLAILCGIATMHIVETRLGRLWALPTRFRKLMDADSVHCVYQPILSLSDNRVDAIEVLARWRDITGETVMPGDFLPIAETGRMTRAFTEVLVRNVVHELSSLPVTDQPMRVHFNIYPEDFDAAWLLGIFSPFLAMRDRFVVVVEILERQQRSLDELRNAIEILRENGILTYVDDFGAGFSNIQFLGHLPLEGVKLDRCFGQAPEGSLMAGLQISASDLIDKTGYKVLVEGVETKERLESLRRGGIVDQAQGYFIARPLTFDGLVAFLDEHATRRASPVAKPVRAKLRQVM